jgi:hypothetical protein
MRAEDVLDSLQRGRTCQDSRLDLVEGRPTGAVRVSVGYMTDPRLAAARLLGFLRRHFVDQTGSMQQEQEQEPDLAPRSATDSEDAATSSSSEASSSAPPGGIYLHSIYVYPIKSCAGAAHPSPCQKTYFLPVYNCLYIHSMRLFNCEMITVAAMCTQGSERRLGLWAPQACVWTGSGPSSTR